MSLIVRQLGVQPYQPIWEAMQRFTNERTDATQDEIWCLQHTPVLTLGQAGKEEHLLNPGNIPVIKVDRGGQVTYHGPGQLVCYLLIDLRRHGIGPRQFVTHIENSLIHLLQHYNVHAQNRPDAPGVYVDNTKIAALGLRIRRGCSFHGLSLNIDMDLSPFHTINPCGHAGMVVTQLKHFVPDICFAEVEQNLMEELRKTLNYDSLTLQTEQLPYD
ncbi:MAG: lipoyl(octanoyl) transferase LipB [Pseudomonadales bacterium]|nr:lipoyl(octanoyl) transferase LipB [Pseudomonadales bacterium]